MCMSIDMSMDMCMDMDMCMSIDMSMDMCTMPSDATAAAHGHVHEH